MRFLKKGDDKKPKSESDTATKGHPDLKVISGSQISGRQPQQQAPPQQQQPQNITLPNIKYKIAVASGKGGVGKIDCCYQPRHLLSECRRRSRTDGR